LSRSVVAEIVVDVEVVTFNRVFVIKRSVFDCRKLADGGGDWSQSSSWRKAFVVAEAIATAIRTHRFFDTRIHNSASQALYSSTVPLQV
jgi:hypothetical protein